MNSPVRPAAPVSTPGGDPGQGQTARGHILNAPPNLTLAKGDVVPGQVVGVQNGQATIRTASGTLIVQTNARLQLLAPVTLQVQSGGGQLQVVLLVPSTQSAERQISTGQPPHAATDTATGRPAAPVLTRGSLITATVTADPAVAAARQNNGQKSGKSPGQSPSQSPGQSPGQSPSQAPGQSPGPSQGNAGAPLTPVAEQGGGSHAVVLRAGANLILRVLGVSLPSEAQAPRVHAAATPGARVLVGTVGANGPAGLPVIRTESGDITLTTVQNLATGSRLLLEIVRLNAPAQVEALGTARDGIPEIMRQAMDALHHADPRLHRSLAQNLPNTGPRLAPTMLFFLSAVLSGDMQRIFSGDGVQLLTRIQRSLVERMAEDLGQAQRNATGNAPHDWRSFLIPVSTGETFEPVYFLFQREPEEAAKTAQAPGVRFVIEVEMSRLGPFRFDGLARAKQVELLIETRAPLPADMRNDIRSIYIETLSALGVAGTIAFHTTPDITIDGNAAARGPRNLTV